MIIGRGTGCCFEGWYRIFWNFWTSNRLISLFFFSFPNFIGFFFSFLFFSLNLLFLQRVNDVSVIIIYVYLYLYYIELRRGTKVPFLFWDRFFPPSFPRFYERPIAVLRKNFLHNGPSDFLLMYVYTTYRAPSPLPHFHFILRDDGTLFSHSLPSPPFILPFLFDVLLPPIRYAKIERKYVKRYFRHLSSLPWFFFPLHPHPNHHPVDVYSPREILGVNPPKEKEQEEEEKKRKIQI